MSYFSFLQLQSGLKMIEPYQSRNFRAQIFIEEGGLFIYLSPSKALSKKVTKQLETIGWKYDQEKRRLYFETPDMNELLTHSNKYIRAQAQRHIECMKIDSM